MINEVVPKYLKNLLEISTKSELKKYSRTISINLRDFANLICNCHTLGYNHQIRYHDFVPQHLIPTEKDRDAIGSASGGKLEGNAKTAWNKIRQIFTDRRCLIAHVFYNATKWHLFYFDQRDFETQTKNHWKEGSHIHFVNFLWTQYNINTINDIFDNCKTSISGKLHIRFVNPSDYESRSLF